MTEEPKGGLTPVYIRGVLSEGGIPCLLSGKLISFFYSYILSITVPVQGSYILTRNRQYDTLKKIMDNYKNK